MSPASAPTSAWLPDLPGDEDAEFCVQLAPFLNPPPLQLLFLWIVSTVLPLGLLFLRQVISVEVRGGQGWQFLGPFQIETAHVIGVWGTLQFDMAYVVGIRDLFQIEMAHVVEHWGLLQFEVAHMISIQS